MNDQFHLISAVEDWIESARGCINQIATFRGLAGEILHYDTDPGEHYLRAQTLITRLKAAQPGCDVGSIQSLARIIGTWSTDRDDRRLPHHDEIVRLFQDAMVLVGSTADVAVYTYHRERKQTPHGITDNEYSVLLALRDVFPRRLRMSDIADTTMIDRGTCGAICADLSGRGYVDYNPDSRKGAAITSEGRAILEQH